jgi:hypothetical protein
MSDLEGAPGAASCSYRGRQVNNAKVGLASPGQGSPNRLARRDYWAC